MSLSEGIVCRVQCAAGQSVTVYGCDCRVSQAPLDVITRSVCRLCVQTDETQTVTRTHTHNTDRPSPTAAPACSSLRPRATLRQVKCFYLKMSAFICNSIFNEYLYIWSLNNAFFNVGIGISFIFPPWLLRSELHSDA